MRALLFAALAAVGNSLVALGQVKGGTGKNPFMFLTFALSICLALVSGAALLMENGGWVQFARNTWIWFSVTGVGFFLTFTGFYLLYSRFGASSYVLYAVISLTLTTLGVGVGVLHEKLGMMRGLALVTCLITVVLFSLGKPKPIAREAEVQLQNRNGAK